MNGKPKLQMLQQKENANSKNPSLKNSHEGHRERLRKKFTENPHSLFDYEILEMLLFYLFPRKDTKPLAKSLLQKFGNLKSVVQASENELKRVPGIGNSSAVMFKLMRELFTRITFQPLKDEIVIASNIHVLEYYQQLLATEKKEQLRAMFINNKNKLIAEEQIQNGTINQTAIYPREIIQRALDYGASALIIVHNHPSGNINPSPEDISVTKMLNELTKQLGIQLLDHLIIGEKGVFSFAQKKLI